MPTFNAWLRQLWQTVHHPDGREYTIGEVQAGLASAGIRLDPVTLQELLDGTRSRPDEATVAAIAAFFDFDATYFADSPAGEQIRRELADFAELRASGVLKLLRDAQVKHLGFRGCAVSGDPRLAIETLAKALRAAQEPPQRP
ncbi:hypothetical protein [Planomonospora sp. ID82291]|uniref:hypothetical protein n=1 Tax=Planomonospora sp. ID82291 TaxID=2738136 RepID=UPI0018C42560|nr:hypothetical protein [Planomonospora sp. ID82291]MBG0818320.1 hypothetical protein [Planomonospora sp. ID82291]